MRITKLILFPIICIQSDESLGQKRGRLFKQYHQGIDPRRNGIITLRRRMFDRHHNGEKSYAESDKRNSQEPQFDRLTWLMRKYAKAANVAHTSSYKPTYSEFKKYFRRYFHKIVWQD